VTVWEAGAEGTGKGVEMVVSPSYTMMTHMWPHLAIKSADAGAALLPSARPVGGGVAEDESRRAACTGHGAPGCATGTSADDAGREGCRHAVVGGGGQGGGRGCR